MVLPDDQRKAIHAKAGTPAPPPRALPLSWAGTPNGKSPFEHKGSPRLLGRLMARAGERRKDVQDHAEAIFGFEDASRTLDEYDEEMRRLNG